MKYLLKKLSAMKLILTLCIAVLATGCATTSDRFYSRAKVTIGNPNYVIERHIIVSDDHKYCNKKVIVVNDRRNTPKCDHDTKVVKVVKKYHPVSHVIVTNNRDYKHDKKVIVTHRDHNYYKDENRHNQNRNYQKDNNKHNNHRNKEYNK